MTEQGETGAGRVRVGPHVESVRGPEGGRYPYGNPLVVTGPEGRLQVDAALGTPIAEVDTVLVSHTHEDHIVGLAAAANLDVRVGVRDLDALRSAEGFIAASGFGSDEWREQLDRDFGYQPVPHATAFADDEVFDLGGAVRVRAVPLPGHTAGHCGFLVEPDGVFYLGDIDLSGFGPFYGDASASLTETLASLDRCGEVEAAAYVTFHHKGPYTDRAQFLGLLAAYRDMVRRRHDSVLALLARPRTAAELTGHGVVYRPGTTPLFGLEAEERMCARHARLLVAEGRAAVDEDGRFHAT